MAAGTLLSLTYAMPQMGNHTVRKVSSQCLQNCIQFFGTPRAKIVIGAPTNSSRVVKGAHHLAHSYRRYEVALSSRTDPLSSLGIIQPPDLASKHVTSLWKWAALPLNCRCGSQSRAWTHARNGAVPVDLALGIDGKGGGAS